MEVKAMPFKLFVKKLSNTLTQHEEDRFAGLIARKSRTLKTYHVVEKIWNEAAKTGPFDQVNVAADWDALQKRINVPLQPAYARIHLNRYLARIAAILLLAAGLSAGLYKLISTHEIDTSGFTRIEAVNGLRDIVLPDGSQITLNIGSALSYRSDFNAIAREVILEGEGLFDVVSNPSIPFRVFSGELIVTVTGTSFSIREEEGSVKVSVLSGTVLMSDKDDQDKAIRVTANQSGYLLSGHELKVENNIEVNNLSWKTGHLIFDETPLDSALYDIARHFRKKLTLEKGITVDITAEFQDQPLHEILEELEQVAGLVFDTTGAALIVRK